MKGSAVNSSSSALGYFWSECNTYVNGTGKSGVPSAGLLILFTTYCFEFLVGAPSNLWLISHILRKRSKVTGILPADFFPFHLALTQLFLYPNVPILFVNRYLWRSRAGVHMITFLTGMANTMKPLLLCLVCVERYMAVVRPLDYLWFKGHQYRWGCMGVSWCIYILMALIGVFNGRSSFIVCAVLLPVFAIDTFCCLSVLKTLQKPPLGDRGVTGAEKKGEVKREAHKSRSRAGRTEEGKQEQSRREERKEEKVRKAQGSKPRGRAEMNSMKRKAFITIAVIQAVLTLNYLPFIVFLPVKGLVPARTFKCQFNSVALAAAASCSYLQPLLYLHRLGRLPCMKSQNA